MHQNNARQVDGIADAVNSALDYGVDKETGLADTIVVSYSPFDQTSLRLTAQGRRDVNNEEARPSQAAPGQSSSQQSGEKSNDPLQQLASKAGLGGLIGNSHHGVGLLPVRVA